MSLKTEDSNAKQRDKVEQFIYNSNGPFDASSCSSTTGVCINTVRRYLKKFEDWGLVNKIRHGQKKVYTKKKVTASVKHSIKNATMRTPAAMLKEYELFYQLALSIFGIFTFGAIS